MSKKRDEFPLDEFDTSGQSVIRPGVHRNRPSVWSMVWPFLLVIALSSGLGVGTVYLLTQNPQSKVNELLGDVVDSPSASPDEEAAPEGPDAEPDAGEPDPDAEPSTDPSDEPSQEPTDEQTDELAPSLDRTVSVRVLNAGAPAGTAGEVAQKLTADGWTAVEATNFEGDRPSASVVYYRGPENLANAQHIGELAGVSNLEEVESLRAAVSVVLR